MNMFPMPRSGRTAAASPVKVTREATWIWWSEIQNLSHRVTASTNFCRPLSNRIYLFSYKRTIGRDCQRASTRELSGTMST